ncbi:MAG: DUF2238 domain-containing protein, partial [Gammaproteobacteria bacterium]|nr:DUF2238 domain-containing protein [Gammaproteobacteria bacterium]
GGDLGVAYLGTQGDIWDAQKDMAYATIGSIIALLLHCLWGSKTSYAARVLKTPVES